MIHAIVLNRTRRRSLLLALVPLVLLSLACGLGDAISDMATPDGRIAAASRTPECRAELRRVLEQYRAQEGMGFATTDEMVEQLMTDGSTFTSYTRDGTSYTPHFAVDASGGQCQLDYYQLTTRRPGQVNSQLFQHETALSSSCTCELPPAE